MDKTTKTDSEEDQDVVLLEDLVPRKDPKAGSAKAVFGQGSGFSDQLKSDTRGKA